MRILLRRDQVPQCELLEQEQGKVLSSELQQVPEQVVAFLLSNVQEAMAHFI